MSGTMSAMSGAKKQILGIVFDFASGRPTRGGRKLPSILPHVIEIG